MITVRRESSVCVTLQVVTLRVRFVDRYAATGGVLAPLFGTLSVALVESKQTPRIPGIRRDSPGAKRRLWHGADYVSES
jgi:hypothetical protein